MPTNKNASLLLKSILEDSTKLTSDKSEEPTMQLASSDKENSYKYRIDPAIVCKLTVVNTPSEFSKFCYYAFKYNTHLDFCLNTYFNPYLPQESPYKESIKYFISFYKDFILSYNTRTPVGKIKETLEDIKSDEKNSSTFLAMSRFFSLSQKTSAEDRHDFKPFILYPIEESELNDLGIAINIVNWQNLLILADIGDYALDKLFSPADNPVNTKISKVTTGFITNLYSKVIDTFYKSSSPFKSFLLKYKWGNPDNQYKPVYNKQLVKDTDIGLAAGYNDGFVYSVFIAYLNNILLSHKVRPEKIFSSANTLAKVLAVQGKSNYEPDSRVSDTDINSNPEDGLTTNISSDDDLNIIDTGIENYDDEIHLREILDTAKEKTDWNNFETTRYLSETLDTPQGALGLGSILSKILLSIPSNVFGLNFTFTAIVDNKSVSQNMLTYIKSFATSSNLIQELFNLYYALEFNDSFLEAAEYKQHTNVLSLLTVADIDDMISELPVTVEEAKKTLNITFGSVTGGASLKGNTATNAVNDIYKKLQKSLPLLSTTVSPTPLEPIPGKLIMMPNDFQKSLGTSAYLSDTTGIRKTSLDVVPKTTDVSRSARAEISKASDLQILWNNYINAIKAILFPTTNIDQWGLNQPTQLAFKPDPDASYFVAFPTDKYPTTKMEILSPTGKKKRLGGFLFSSVVEYNTFRDRVLAETLAQKDSILSATSLGQIVESLNNILLVLGDKKRLEFFSSKDTQPLIKDSTMKLCQLIDPKYAITSTLVKIDETHQFPLTRGANSNSFIDLVSNILILNNKTTNESILFSTAINIFEDNKNPTELSDNYYCYAIINTHIRANVIKTLINLTEAIENLLILLRKIVTKVPNILAETLAQDNYGKTSELYNWLASVIIKIVSSSSEDFNNLDDLISSEIDPILTRFKNAEARKATSLAVLKPTNKAKKIYG